MKDRVRRELENNIHFAILDFFDKCKSLTQDEKNRIKSELGWNKRHCEVDYDVRYSAEKEIARMVYLDWHREHIHSLKLWEDVVRAAASHSDKPHEIANEAVKEYESKYMTP